MQKYKMLEKKGAGPVSVPTCKIVQNGCKIDGLLSHNRGPCTCEVLSQNTDFARFCTILHLFCTILHDFAPFGGIGARTNLHDFARFCTYFAPTLHVFCTILHDPVRSYKMGAKSANCFRTTRVCVRAKCFLKTRILHDFARFCTYFARFCTFWWKWGAYDFARFCTILHLFCTYFAPNLHPFCTYFARFCTFVQNCAKCLQNGAKSTFAPFCTNKCYSHVYKSHGNVSECAGEI